MTQDITPHVQGTLADGIYTITISNPAKMNAMSLEMWEKFAACVHDANRNKSVRVIAVTGHGRKAFMSGADISKFSSQRANTIQREKYAIAVREAQTSLMQSPHPTVAIIRGVCMGGGVALALACDLRYCNTRSRFGMPAAKLGLAYAPEGVGQAIKVLGTSRASDLFLTARIFDGQEAARIGFVNEVFPDDLFDTIITQRLNSMAKLAPLSLQAFKKAKRYYLNDENAPSLEEVKASVTACFESQDFAEGQQAFLAKRSPNFKGK